MHFSIPETEELKEGAASYTMYNININGVFHCRARYKQLRQFHDELKKEFGSLVLPEFPKKKLLALSPQEVEQRRIMLERYIQIVSQDPQICSSDLFNTFLLTAQQESQAEDAEHVSIDTFLMNGHKITTSLMSTDQTEDVLESIAQMIEIPDDLVHYFGLFLVRKEADGDSSIVRQMQDFESPYLSLKAANKNGIHRIVLRKCYWDSSFDKDLLENKVTMNLLYVQACSDVERQWVLATKEQLIHLDKLRKKGSKREFLRMVSTLKYYGYVHFKPCTTDYPEPNTRVIVAAGHTELNFRVNMQGQVKEGSFRITRMRCWRITSVYQSNEDKTLAPSSQKSMLELSFEYLMSRDTLQWISIISDQAMLISTCLQSMVDELIMIKQNKKFKKDVIKTCLTYGDLNKGKQPAGGQEKHFRDSFNCFSTELKNLEMLAVAQLNLGPIFPFASPQDRLKVSKNTGPFKPLSRELSYGVDPEEQSTSSKVKESVKKMGRGLQKPEQTITENEAFEEIGDEDL